MALQDQYIVLTWRPVDEAEATISSSNQRESPKAHTRITRIPRRSCAKADDILAGESTLKWGEFRHELGFDATENA